MKYFNHIFLLMLCWESALAEPVAYISESEFLSVLGAMGKTVTHEGFESNARWGHVRSGVGVGTNTAASVDSKGIRWSSNFQAGHITTGTGPAISGNYGVYSSPHGSYSTPDPGSNCLNPGECGDGLRGAAIAGRFIAIGGWFDTNTPYAKMGLFLGNYPANPIGFGETCTPPESENCVGNSTIGTMPEFFGVIDTAGFERFEYRELEGKLEIDGGDIKYIFADDFRFVIEKPDEVFRDGFE